MYVDDMCIDYDLKFCIEKHKLINKKFQFGLSLNKNYCGTYAGDRYEYYLSLFLFKYVIFIGWLLRERKGE